MTKARDESLTAEDVKGFVSYDPATGVFRWLPRSNPSPESWNSSWAGKVAGTTTDRGYRTICIEQVDYFAHRWTNLREATRTENFYNRRVRRDCVSGLKGAHKYKDRKLWGSAIRINGKKVGLGTFNCPAAAHFAYVIAASKTYGEFARLQ